MNTAPSVIGVAGTNGSGKDAVMAYLSKNYRYLSMSATDMFDTELQHRGLPTDRLHKAELSAEWRREFGMGVIVTRAYEAWKSQASNYTGVVIGSLRHPGEVDSVHDYGGIVIWLDADPRVRYDRIQANAALRGRAIEDAISFEQFQADEVREMHVQAGADNATLDMAAVKERADIFLKNDSNDIEAFHKLVIAALHL